MGNRLAVRVSCDYTPIFFVSPSLLERSTPYSSQSYRSMREEYGLIGCDSALGGGDFDWGWP
jgi:hypothetical protein